jgi:hypothetical protein
VVAEALAVEQAVKPRLVLALVVVVVVDTATTAL